MLKEYVDGRQPIIQPRTLSVTRYTTALSLVKHKQNIFKFEYETKIRQFRVYLIYGRKYVTKKIKQKLEDNRRL